MSGVLSLRVTKQERAALKRIKDERGCKDLSQTMRVLMGFPRDTPYPDQQLEGADDIESVDALCQVVRRVIDRLDEQHQLTTKIARHLDIPIAERPTRSSVSARLSKGAPEVPIPVVAGELVNVGALPTRNGHNHPTLPDGFSRG